MRLAGRKAIITGAASGIGRATARLFADEGAQVLAVDLPKRELAAQFIDKRIFVFERDVASENAAEKIVAEAIERMGGLDILMNNAGISRRAPPEEMSSDEFDQHYRVNLRAQFLLCRAAIPHLKKSSAPRIINVASVMAQGTDFGLAGYSATKAGVEGLTRNLALELGKFQITVNFIEPGAILTGMTEKNFSIPEIAAVWAKKSALRRLGQPEDIARGALFLASDDAAFMTGQGLRIDGGLTLRI